ncbi:MAG: hypothetical protein IKY67_08580, partial [Paludibacteraceae bacterium]|nr:hypothetical protein [Paludibacteraceae bacterium]
SANCRLGDLEYPAEFLVLTVLCYYFCHRLNYFYYICPAGFNLKHDANIYAICVINKKMSNYFSQNE